MEHKAIQARIEVSSAAEHDTIQTIQHPTKIFFIHNGREDDRYSASHADRFTVARMEMGKGGDVFAG
jgi:hypothetical protein